MNVDQDVTSKSVVAADRVAYIITTRAGLIKEVAKESLPLPRDVTEIFLSFLTAACTRFRHRGLRFSFSCALSGKGDLRKNPGTIDLDAVR